MGNLIKRKALYHYFRDFHLDVVLLQETHTTKNTRKKWEQEWGGKWVVSYGTTSKLGTAILFNPKKGIEITSMHSDESGRFVICNVSIDETRFTIGNVYAPNDDTPDFYKRFLNKIDQMATDNVIIGGDFNLTLQPDLDRHKSLYNNNKAAQILKEGMDQLQLRDIWRDRNPTERRYSWFKRNPELRASRIDFFLVNLGMSGNVDKVDYHGNGKSDHSLVTLEYVNDNFKRGKGVWKLNNLLLQNTEYCQTIRKLIQEIRSRADIAKLSKREAWEIVKMECAEKSQQYAIAKAHKNKQLLFDLYKIKDNMLSDEVKFDMKCNQDNYDQVIAKINELERERVQGSIFRSRSKWQLYGCKSSKYFFSLERRNYGNKTMFAIILDSGEICKSQSRILNEQISFYEQLYTKDPVINFNITNNTDIKVTEDSKRLLQLDLTIAEIDKAMKEMSLGKVAGCDGLSLEFYRTFWGEIRDLLMQVYQEMYAAGILTTSMRKGVMSLIPKKLKDPRKICNLRPITLLNNDFKILAKAIANRLKAVLPEFVLSEQTGFMQGRHLHDNVRRTMDIIAHVNKSNDRAVIISVDYEKCFDRIEHASIFAALKFFNIPDEFIKWTQLFFNDLKICTQNAGEISHFVSKTRGINQGCPISPLCFNVVGAVLALLIKTNEKIKGLKPGRIALPEVITQFADDTGLYLEYSQESLDATLSTLTCIERNTGLKISYDKTCIYRVGSIKFSNAKLYTQTNLKWSDEDIEMLGISISNQNVQSTAQYDVCINKIDNVVNTWGSRQLPLNGKILLVNSLMGSLFNHAMLVLPAPTKEQIQRFEHKVQKFLWGGKRSKIPMKILKRNKKQGGLGLVDLETRYIALQAKWVYKALFDESFDYANSILNVQLGKKFWECNLNEKDVTRLCEPSAWRNIRLCWARVSFYSPTNKYEVKKQYIWYNSHIRQNRQVLVKNEVISAAGINKMQDVIKSDGTFYSIEEFMNKHTEIKQLWFWYKKLLASIPTSWKLLLKENNDLGINEKHVTIEILTQKNYGKTIYNKMIERKCIDTDLNPYKERWETKTDFCTTMNEYLELFKDIYKLTSSVKLQNFQYRLLLNKIFTNDTLAHWKIVPNNLCEICNENTKQTIDHLLYECTVVQTIWKKLESELAIPDTVWNCKTIFSNQIHREKLHIVNLIALITKQVIFRLKCLKERVSYTKVAIEIKMFHSVESWNAQIQCKTVHHEKIWSPVKEYVEQLYLLYP